MARLTVDGTAYAVTMSAENLLQELATQKDRLELATADGTLVLRPALAAVILVEDDTAAGAAGAAGARARPRKRAE